MMEPSPIPVEGAPVPALLFDLYGVIMKGQTEAGMAEIQRAAGHPGDDFWPAYWGCRDGYGQGRPLARGLLGGAAARVAELRAGGDEARLVARSGESTPQFAASGPPGP